MDRRTYFKHMALATAGVLIAPQLVVSCKDDLPNYMSPFNLDPFKTLDEIRHFVKGSKGHLVLEVERLIEEKNAAAIFKFIQERIASIPAKSNSITSNAYEVRWGKEGMLRCGKGTLREKSDLLYLMLLAAGFEPTYHRASFPMTPEKVTQVFCRKMIDNDTIEVPQKYLDKWNTQLMPTEATTLTKGVDLSGEKSIALARNLIEKLPDDYIAKIAQPDWLDVDGIEAPVVKITIDNQEKHLNFVENKVFEKFNMLEQHLYNLDAHNPEERFEKMKITVRVLFSDAINNPVDIVSGEWDLKYVLGKQVALQFVSPIPQEQLLQTPMKDIQQFVPILALQHQSMSTSSLTEGLLFKGVGFDLLGNTFYEDNDGAILMNDLKMNEVQTQDVAAVKTLKIVLADGEYPTISVRCAPLDENGKLVLGLSGSVFSITDQGQVQRPIIIQNAIVPKILVLFDATGSMPYPYSARSFPKEIKNQIQQHLDREFQTAVIDIKSYELEFLDVLESTSLKKYDHILCIGDGESFDHILPTDLKAVLKNTSISYHFITNSYSNQSSEAVRLCFEKADYPFFEMVNFASDLNEIAKIISANEQYPYVLQYEAPWEDDNVIHDVHISMHDNKAVAPVKDRYIMNRDRVYEEKGVPCGVSISLEWKDGYERKSVSKHIAGFDPTVDTTVTVTHKEAIRSFALGTHRFFFEADKATLPTLLDDVLSSKLSVAAFFESKNEGADEMLKHVNNFTPLASEALSIFAPLPDAGENWITFEDNFQTCFYSEFVNFEKEEAYKKMDIWPTSDVRTFAKTKKEAFRKTMEVTALLAVTESTLFKKSTLSDLSKKDILLYDDYSFENIPQERFKSFYPHTYNNYTHYILHERTLSTLSHWEINKETGAVLGILSDGSGGGLESTVKINLKIIDSYAAAYNKAAAPLMSDPLAFGTVTMYGQFLARLYGLVCVALIAMDATKLPAESRQAIKSLAYNVIKSFAFAKFKPLAKFEKILDKLFDPGWPDVGK